MRPLIGAKEILRVSRSIYDDELFGLWSFCVMRFDAGQAWPITAGIVTGHEIKLAAFQLFGVRAPFRAEKHNAVKFAWVRLGIGIAHRVAPQGLRR